MLYPNTFNERRSLTPRRHRPVITPPVRFVRSDAQVYNIECKITYKLGAGNMIDLSQLSKFMDENPTDEKIIKPLNEVSLCLRLLKEFTSKQTHSKYTITSYKNEANSLYTFIFTEITGFRKMKISKKSRFHEKID
jgi:hypothetical protein